ncbi:small multi-drug export protein [Pseudogracilibacillus auburnensis]|uniref:Putative small multi-drug export protein n=1 Tax=Pseudogracilibacillus auburnensis TaxID=1494959 RepID=A0A2V3VZN7_9BACI|nr:small multi-drug export protein [Pseudogracilibacillus auburnensis]MBO1002205.1 small multi-drug export protein [Pseudogracilibacillus auburnensis]PXW87533.1 putative small multi-drug export protein [Pseudogracilibacillus auburnensis]
MLWTYIIIFLLAAIPFFEIVTIVPIAIIGGVPAVPVMIVAFLGNMLTIALLILFLDKIREWRRKRKGEEQGSKRHKRAKSLWDKYGLPGIAFIGPFFVGSHLSAMFAIIFGGNKRKTFYLMTASLFCWTVALGLAAHYGFDFLIADEENLGFITRLLNR